MTGWSGWVAGWVLKRPRAVLGVLAAATAAFALFLPQLRISSDLRTMVPPDDPVLQQLRQAADEFGSQDMVMVVVTAPNVFDVSLLQRAWRLAAQLEQVPRVQRVISPFNVQLAMGSPEGLAVEPAAESVPATPEEVARWRARLVRSPLASSLVAPEGQALAILVELERGVGFEDVFAREVAPALQALAAEFQGQAQEQGQVAERVLIVGEPYLGYSITRSVRRDMVVLFPLAVAVVLASLYATFRSLAALVLPMVPVLLSLTWTLGLMAALGAQLTIVSAAMPVMLVVVGSASAIHILNRYRELRWLGLEHGQAVERAMATLAGALVMVSLTDAAGFASLGTSFVQPVREFGLFTAAAILFSLLASLVAVPAVLR
ncbi:MAG TPA: MMPL family transporter, partial [Limnochordales bacterium]